jgi:hypothetical protein
MGGDGSHPNLSDDMVVINGLDFVVVMDGQRAKVLVHLLLSSSVQLLST